MACNKCSSKAPVVIQIDGGGAVNSVLGVSPVVTNPTSGTVNVSLRYASGIATINFPGGSDSASAAISFPPGMFTTPPIITGNRVFQAGDITIAQGFIIWFGSVTVNGTTMWAEQGNAAVVPAGIIHAHWQAFAAS